MLSTGVVAQNEVPETKLDSLKMTSDTLLLEGVNIVADRPLFSVEGEKTLYQVSDDPTVQSGMASDALQNAPGVSVDVEGKVTLRGPEIVQRIREHQPPLTEGEFKVCILSMMPFAVKEVADILEVSSAMIGKYRTGIRKKIGLFTYAQIWRELQERLGREVDLVEEGTLKPFAVESANRDKKLVYEASHC